MERMVDLIHLNGAPGAGKSALAAALVGQRPLALNLDIDEIRSKLGAWEESDDAKEVARGLGFRMAAWHLESGRRVRR